VAGSDRGKSGRLPLWRAVATAAAMMMAVTLGAAATSLPAQASHGGCTASNCAGKWPSSENCISGSSAIRSAFYHSGLQSIHAVYRSHCSYWARHTYDKDQDPHGGYSAVKVQFKIERWAYKSSTSGSFWDLTHTETRTIENVNGTHTTRMVPLYLSDNQIRFRACARFATSTFGGPYSSYGSWVCTSFVTHG
jgi:hypothetical protein